MRKTFFNKYSKSLTFILSIFLVLTVFVGFSIWDISIKNSTSEITSSEPVCYISTNSNKVYYTDVDEAIDAAYKDSNANTIYIIPDKTLSPKIDRSCTLAANDTLTLPYEGETFASKNGTGSSFADGDESKVNQNLVSNLLIENEALDFDGTSVSYQKVTLTIEGKLNVGGVLGCKAVTNGSDSANFKPSGGVTGKYCQITTGYNAHIIFKNGAVLDCYGYIKEKSNTYLSDILKPTIEFENGSTCYQPIIFYDWGGGSEARDEYNAHRFPITIFDFPNIQTETKYYSDSKMYCYASIFISTLESLGQNGLINITFLMVGSALNSETTDAVIKLYDESILTLNYYSFDVKYTTTNFDSYCNIKIEGGASLNNVTIDVKEATGNNGLINGILDMLNLGTLTTSGIFFPFSGRLKFNLDKGTYDINIKAKFLQNSEVIIGEEATINFNNDLLIYNSNSAKTSHYPSDVNESALFINKGKINFKSTSNVGGKISIPSYENRDINASLNLTVVNNLLCSETELNGTNSLQLETDILLDDNTITNIPTKTYYGLVSYNNNYYYQKQNIINISYFDSDDFTNSFNLEIDEIKYTKEDFIYGDIQVPLTDSKDFIFTNLVNISYIKYNNEYYDVGDLTSLNISNVTENGTIEIVAKQYLNNIHFTGEEKSLLFWRTTTELTIITYKTSDKSNPIFNNSSNKFDQVSESLDINTINNQIVLGDWIETTSWNHIGTCSVGGNQVSENQAIMITRDMLPALEIIATHD